MRPLIIAHYFSYLKFLDYISQLTLIMQLENSLLRIVIVLVFGRRNKTQNKYVTYCGLGYWIRLSSQYSPSFAALSPNSRLTTWVIKVFFSFIAILYAAFKQVLDLLFLRVVKIIKQVVYFQIGGALEWFSARNLKYDYFSTNILLNLVNIKFISTK